MTTALIQLFGFINRFEDYQFHDSSRERRHKNKLNTIFVYICNKLSHHVFCSETKEALAIFIRQTQVQLMNFDNEVHRMGQSHNGARDFLQDVQGKLFDLLHYLRVYYREYCCCLSGC